MKIYKYYKQFYGGDYEAFIVKANNSSEALEKIKTYKKNKGCFLETVREESLKVVEFDNDTDVYEF